MLKLFRQLKRYKGAVALIILLLFLQALAELYLPTLMADIVDNGMIKADTAYIWRTGGFMLAIALLNTLCAILANFLSARVAMGFGRDTRNRVFERVENYSLHEVDKIGTASLITRTTNDITQVQMVLVMIFRFVIFAPIMCVGGAVMALSKDLKLSVILLVSIPVLLGSIMLIATKVMPMFKVMQKKLDRINLVLRENLTGIRVIRAFCKLDMEKKRFSEANADMTQTAIRANKIMALMQPSMMIIMNATSVAIVWFAGLRIGDGQLQVGDMMAFLQYAMHIMFSFVMISIMYVMIPRAQASAERINEVLELTPEITDDGKAKPDENVRGYVEFKDVSFRYHGAQDPVLSHISFSAKPGETTAIIGSTGSGKSTLVSLLPRFYDVSEGAILVDGIDIRDLPQETLRDKIGFVPQTAVLFTGTVAENIRYGKDDATDFEVVHAAKVAQADDFVSKMEAGYDSFVSLGGGNLSGGQKQRLSIARALVRKPEIYVFDDSFSALDFKTESRLREALADETKDATVLIVAQRVSTILDADRIIVLDQGQVQGIGTHAELMQSCAVYREIVSSQFKEEELA